MSEVLSTVELCLWNPPDGDCEKPTHGRVQSALRDEGLSGDHAEPIPDGTAWRRACDSLRDKATLVRPFDVKGVAHVQVDREEVEGEELVRRQVGVYKLRGMEVGSDGVSDWGTHTALINALDATRVTYTASDLTKTIQSVLVKDGLGLYSPRKAGGVYFVPVSPDNATLLDRVERFSAAVGVRFLRYAVPDTAAQRAEVADAVAAKLATVVDDHEAAVSAYTAETMPATLARRREAMGEVSMMLVRLHHLLNGHAVELARRLDALTVRLTELAAAEPVASGGRRVTYA